MDITQFTSIKKQFQGASLDDKIKMYTTLTDLTQEQYVELLRVFPREHINKLEAALNA